MKFNRQIYGINYELIIMILIGLIFNSINSYAKSTFSSDRIKSAVLSIIAEKSNHKAEVEFTSIPRTVEFTEDGIEAEIITDEIINPGINEVSLKFSKDGKLIKFVNLTIRIKLLREIWVASRQLSTNTIITQSDIVSKEKYILDDIGYPSLNELLGKELKRVVIKDDVITKDMLSADLIIKRGERVTMIVESGAIRIRCTGVAAQDGSEGQLIRVKRDNSNNVLTGKVAIDGTVIIYSNNLSLNQEK